MASRTRNKDIVSVLASTYAEQRDTQTGVLRSTSVRTYYPYHCTENMIDEVIPHFHSRRKVGEVFFNPMTKTKIVNSTIPSYLSGGTIDGKTSDIGSYDYIGQRGIPFKSGPTTRAADLLIKRNLASTSALSKASSEEVMILATIGEARETKAMLLNTLRHLMHLRPLLRSYYNLLRLGNKSKGKYARDLYMKAESVWMEIRMGWRPFAYECKSLYNAITSKKSYPERQTFRGGVSDLVYDTSDTYTSSGTFKRTYKEETRIRAGSLHQQRKYGFPDVFGLTKIPQTIWELTKLSWAVDYFFNVGKAVAAYTPDTFWECLGGWVTYRTTIIQTVELLTVNIAGWQYPVTSGGKKTQTTTVVQRIPGTFIGVHFSPRMNLAKYIDVLAASRQQFMKLINLCLKERRKRKRRS